MLESEKRFFENEAIRKAQLKKQEEKYELKKQEVMDNIQKMQERQ